VETANFRDVFIIHRRGEELEKGSRENSHRRGLSVVEEVKTARVRAGPGEVARNGVWSS
jgi:hypothetical protein